MKWNTCQGPLRIARCKSRQLCPSSQVSLTKPRACAIQLALSLPQLLLLYVQQLENPLDVSHYAHMCSGGVTVSGAIAWDSSRYRTIGVWRTGKYIRRYGRRTGIPMEHRQFRRVDPQFKPQPFPLLLRDIPAHVVATAHLAAKERLK